MSISQACLLHVAYQEKSWFVAMRKVLVPDACTSCTRSALHVTKLKKVRMLWSLENPEHFRSSFGPVRGLNLQPMHHFTLG